MNIIIDIDSLKKDLIDYFGTASSYNPMAIMDISKIECASNKEIIDIAIKNGFNLYDYEIKSKTR